MKISLKNIIPTFAVCSTLFLQGCGGGGNSGDKTPPGTNTRHESYPAGQSFKYNRISIAGSSITYGEGYLGQGSYVGEVMKYFREDVADTINPKELESLKSPGRVEKNPLSYMGQLDVYTSGYTISGNLKASKEVVIVYGPSDADIQMSVDGKVCSNQHISSNVQAVRIEKSGVTIDPNTEQQDIDSFRRTEPRSVTTVCKNLENKPHTFTLKVKSGLLRLNFITNHMYYFQNAGIGGYSAATLLKSGTGTTTEEIRDFNPDLLIFESATNDANTWVREQEGSTNDWKLEGLTPFSLVEDKSNQIRLSQTPSKPIVSGDVVVMGVYDGDINSLAVGVVKDYDSNENIITLQSSVPTNVEKSCKVKSVKAWEDNVKEVIRRVTSGRNVTVGIGTSGVPNYDKNNYPKYARRLMGYREKGQILARENGWMFFDFFNYTKNFNPKIEANLPEGQRWSKGDNTHPSPVGFKLFGKAITDVLKRQ